MDLMRETIQKAAGEIASYCSTEEVFAIKKGKHLPSRRVIISLIKEIRRIVFPGYFGSEDLTATDPEYFIGYMMSEVYVNLKEQIRMALIYDNDCYCRDCEEKICEKADEICAYFFSRLPYIQQMLIKDVQAGYDGDPAAKSKEEIIFSYPGLFAIYVYRLAHELYLKNVPLIPRIMTEYAHSGTGIDINAGATIGEYFFIDHGTGIVIGETTVIGDHVKLYQGVTLGALSTRSGQKLSGLKRHPTIGNNVTIYSGSSILGGETVIGDDAVIAGGAFITSSVPARTKVSVKNPELTFKQPRDMSKKEIWE